MRWARVAAISPRGETGTHGLAIPLALPPAPPRYCAGIRPQFLAHSLIHMTHQRSSSSLKTGGDDYPGGAKQEAHKATRSARPVTGLWG
jgi:hypothetical protein